MGVSLDLTVSLSVIIQTVIIGGGGIAAIVTLRNTVSTLKEAVGALKDELTVSKTETKDQFKGIQDELEKMGEILIAQARFDERLINFDKRLTSQGRQIDELRRGEGFIRGGPRNGIDGEYK